MYSESKSQLYMFTKQQNLLQAGCSNKVCLFSIVSLVVGPTYITYDVYVLKRAPTKFYTSLQVFKMSNL